jgi:hypothetical protein
MKEILTPCSTCARIVRTEVDDGVLNNFMLRTDTVQRLFPHHTADEREAVMGYRNGWYLCPKCWTEQIGDDDDSTE